MMLPKFAVARGVSLSPSPFALSLLLILLFGLSAGNAEAKHWLKLFSNKESQIFVDTRSIVRTGDIVAVWYRRDFSRSMPIQKSKQRYQSSKVLYYYNCTDHQMAAAQWITYEKKGGLGKVIFNKKVVDLEYGDVSDGNASDVIFKFVCKPSKK